MCCPLKYHKNIDFQFGDKRVDRRAKFMVNKMTKATEKSLPQIFSNEKDLKGAYRFFSNDLVTPDKILAPHSIETIQRCSQQKVVLAIQDSSDLDFDYMKCLQEFESLHPNVDKGYRIHPILATTEAGTPLGVLATFNYTRTAEDLSKKHRNSLPIEQKESYRWLLGYREACKLAAQAPDTEVISISDREGDIYESLIEATNLDVNRKAYILFRGKHNRVLVESDKNIDKIEKKMIRCSVTYEAKLNLNKYTKDARTANVVVRASEINLKAPQTCLKKSLSSIKVNAVLVTEVDPPKGVIPLHWLLITTLPIDTPEQIRRIVSLYSQRWVIEIFFKVLKSGCKIDSQRLEMGDRIKNYIALAMIVGWKVMLATYLPRESPDIPCTALFTNIEWKLAYRTVYGNGRPFPKTTPTLKEAINLIAMMGGYQKRKQPPGIQTIWRGITRLMDIVIGFNMTQDIILSQNEED